jgi:hypothetical protein
MPWKDMHQALIDAATKTALVLPEPMPFVLQTSLDDFYVLIRMRTLKRSQQTGGNHLLNLHQNIQDVCNERGIEITPIIGCKRRKQTTIPENLFRQRIKRLLQREFE